MNTKKIAVLGISAALAMVLSFLESLIPPFVFVPGIKIGLANIVNVFLLYRIGFCSSLFVSLIRVTLSSVLFGNAQVFVFSLAGAILSLFGMALLRKLGLFSHITVSVVGGVLHNVGQIAVAVIWTGTPQIICYLPVLLITGTVSGAVIGIVAGLIIKRLENVRL